MTAIQSVSFSYANQWLSDGKRCCRVGWNGKGMWIKLQKPSDMSLITVPFIYMKTADGELVPWIPTQTDLLANDWQLISEL